MCTKYNVEIFSTYIYAHTYIICLGTFNTASLDVIATG